MIITSLVTSEQYIYTMIPKTGTVSYRFLFSPNDQPQEEGVVFHLHTPYFHDAHEHGRLPGFAVVRDPAKRLESSLHYIKKQIENPTPPDYMKVKVGFSMPFDDITQLCDFLNTLAT
jgi:hypothetical protein